MPDSLKTTKRNGLIFSYRNEEEFERIYEDIFKRHEYPFKSPKSAPFILDCGAHIGLATLFFKKLKPRGKIIAFEPNALNFKLLQKNVKQNSLTDIELINAAVYDSGGKIDFYVDRNSKNPWTWGDSSVINKWYSKETTKTIKVKAVNLSIFIDREVDLLKLDVEGLEERILISIKNKLKNIKEIMMEFHGSSTNPNNNELRIIEILKRNGFNVKVNQDWKFIHEAEIKRPDPYTLSLYAENRF